jgi:pilus assembly protein CpaE
MIAEVAANNRVNETFRQIGMQVTGRATAVATGKSSSLKMPSFLKRKRA